MLYFVGNKRLYPVSRTVQMISALLQGRQNMAFNWAKQPSPTSHRTLENSRNRSKTSVLRAYGYKAPHLKSQILAIEIASFPGDRVRGESGQGRGLPTT